MTEEKLPEEVQPKEAIPTSKTEEPPDKSDDEPVTVEEVVTAFKSGGERLLGAIKKPVRRAARTYGKSWGNAWRSFVDGVEGKSKD